MNKDYLTTEDGREVDAEEAILAVIEKEVPMLFGDLSEMDELCPIEGTSLAYDYESISIISHSDIAPRNPKTIENDIFLQLFERGVIKFCPQDRTMVLDDGELVVQSNVIYPHWLCFGKLIKVFTIEFGEP